MEGGGGADLGRNLDVACTFNVFFLFLDNYLCMFSMILQI